MKECDKMSTSRKTERMSIDSRATEILASKEPSRDLAHDDRATAIMSNNEIDSQSSALGIGANIGGYLVRDIIAENTGEATLFLAESKGIKYIVKLYHKNKQPASNLTKATKELASPYIIKIIDSGIYSERFYEILPYFKNGDLQKYAPLKPKEIIEIVIPCVNEGLKELHSKGIVHRDIKPSNLFYDDEKKKVIIGDFGISSVLESGLSVRATTMSRTFGYAAPETANGFVSKESDYYSLGITVLHLLTGQDPFLGMTDMEILFQTINKTLIVPASIDNRLQKLIKGLTLKDRNDRWGYEEIVKWLNGEDIDVKEAKNSKRGYKPYNFNYNRYYGLEEISMAFAHDWENAKKHLKRGLVDKNILQYGEEYSVDIAELREEPDQDLAVYKMIYILNPTAPLCYKGKVYYDLESIGRQMRESLPNFNEEIRELVIKGCLQDFLTRNNFDENLCKRVSEITEKLKSKDNKYYYALMYLLSPDSKFVIKNQEFDTLESLANYMETLLPHEIEDFANDLVDNQRFIMWVYSQGYASQVNEWLDIYEKAEW